MKTFIIRTCIWTALLFLPIICAFHILGVTPCVSNNPSVNHKLYVSSLKEETHFNVIAVGSSITLNNLYSPVIVSEVDNSFYNFACSGLNISIIRSLSEFYLEKYNYSTLIIASQIEDFNLEQLFTFPTKFELEMMYDRHYYLLSLGSPFKSLSNKSQVETDSTKMSYQRYDEWGGAYLHINQSNAQKERWNFAYTPCERHHAYQHLEELCTLLKSKQKHLIFAISPYKPGFVTEKTKNDYINHLQTCSNILQKFGYELYDFSQDPHFNDSHFADAIHLNKEGAKLFTSLLAEKVQSNQ